MKRFFVGFLLAVGLIGCTEVQTTRSGAIGVQRKQYMMVSAQQAEQMSASAYLQEKRVAYSKGALNADTAQLARLRAIASRIIPQTAVFRPDAPSWKWEVNLETSNQANAYCMAGGKIMFYTGLLDQLKLSDDEIAAVMAHEISHALREHTRERLSEAYAQQMVMAGLAAAAKMNDNQVAAMQNIVQVSMTLPHSREQEAEADRMGLELMARAGYDPRAAITLWQKMGKMGGGRPPEFLSDHPSDQRRMQDMQALLPTVMPLYEATKPRAAPASDQRRRRK